MTTDMPVEVLVWRWTEQLPPERQAFGHAIVRIYFALTTTRSAFAQALGLLDHAKAISPEHTGEQIRQRLAWEGIAFREAAMQLFHFGMLLEGLVDNLKDVGLLPKYDRVQLRQIRRAFDLHFPDWRSLRNAIGHHAELFYTPKAVELNSISEAAFFGSGDHNRKLMVTHIDDRRYSMSKDGRMVSIELSQQSLGYLTDLETRAKSVLKAALLP